MRQRIWKISLLVGCCAVLASCHAGKFTYVGTEARPEGRIPIEAGGPHAGVWQDENLSVRYTYVKKPDVLQLEGTVALEARLTKSFQTVDHFSVLAAFMDAHRRILKTEVLVVVGQSIIRPWSFDTVLNLPPQVTAFNFSYRGTAYDSGAETGKVSSPFWKTP